MSKVLRPIGHEDRLSIVDHLDELRSRLIVCGIALAFAVCFWQNQALLHVLNRALPDSKSPGLAQVDKQQASLRKAMLQIASGARDLANSPNLSAAERAGAAQIESGANLASK